MRWKCSSFGLNPLLSVVKEEKRNMEGRHKHKIDSALLFILPENVCEWVCVFRWMEWVGVAFFKFMKTVKC